MVQELDRGSASLEVLAKDHLFHAVNQFVEKVRVHAHNSIMDNGFYLLRAISALLTIAVWGVQEEPQAIRNMVNDQLKEIQDTFGKHVQNGVVSSPIVLAL